MNQYRYFYIESSIDVKQSSARSEQKSQRPRGGTAAGGAAGPAQAVDRAFSGASDGTCGEGRAQTEQHLGDVQSYANLGQGAQNLPRGGGDARLAGWRGWCDRGPSKKIC